jgi:lysyl-tRNA synthetase, class II
MTEERSLREIRLEKLARLRELGLDPYMTEKFSRTHSPQAAVDQFDTISGEETTLSLAGRLVSYRLMGKAGFAHLSDGDSKIQAYFRKDDLTEAEWEAYQNFDLGDHIGVTGFLFLTKTGEKTLHVKSVVPLSKSLQTLPLGKEKDGHQWYGLSDVEQRYRHRHLDLICNAEAREMLVNRSKITSATRRYFDGEGYLEVETPMLQLEAGGAAARPFKTHYNAYDLEVKLRISLELYLKRLICGDLPKVYEIGRVFRNEGVSNRHSPEFSLLEFYEAYVNLEDMMVRVEDLFAYVARDVYGSTKFVLRQGNMIHEAKAGEVAEGEVVVDFSQPWRRLDMMTAISEATGMAVADFESIEKALASARTNDIEAKSKAAGGWVNLAKEDTLGGLIEKLLEVFIEPSLQEPTFIVGYPIETSPLAKKDPNRPGYTRRFEGYVLGREICNAFSEINDPIDQRERFEHQLSRAAAGDDEAHPMDEEFIYALESGMPPTGGCGIGMDRLAMLFTGAESIREILMFPMMKPDGHASESE